MLSEILFAIRADVCCVVIIMLLYLNAYHMIGRSNDTCTLRKIMLFTVVYIVAYSVEELIMEDLVTPSRLLNTIVTITIQLSQSILCYVWFIYSETKQNSRLVDKKWKRRGMFVPVLLFGIILILSTVTGWIFLITEDGFYLRGKGFWIQYIIIAIYLLSTTIKALCKSFSKKNYVMLS